MQLAERVSVGVAKPTLVGVGEHGEGRGGVPRDGLLGSTASGGGVVGQDARDFESDVGWAR